MGVLVLTSENFQEEVYNSDKPVIIDFWASWCGPCKIMSPIIDEIEKDLGDKVKVGKVNVDEETQLAIKFNVMSIPTIIIMKNGQIAKTFIGVTDKNKIINEIQ